MMPTILKPYKKNPRKISDEEQARLKDDLAALGDLGGIVHDLNTGNIVGGHQRLTVMFGVHADRFNLDDAEIEIVKTYKKPSKVGTVGEGFIVWNGERFAYRQVKFTKAQFDRANLVANLRGGTWDEGLLSELPLDLLASVGFDDKFLLSLDLGEKERARNDESADAVVLDQAIQLKPAQDYIVIVCPDAAQWERLKTFLDLPYVRRGGYKKGSPFDSVGVQRVITADMLFARIDADRRAK